ncbi:phage antirepressor KilAC domain-containing protein [Gallibacterium anatis]|uniref:phage antirepressor KilAC domain-containing protein n=1 Tax=Gallibacterium anatis TaxID=750 RepID=UPI00254F62B3|nr:phage antirepressor KilAC domain-containing protein [Gallibacterium anatis]MDK9560980.1 phage antirepressor KilAC domain-containing protein [Gallibacterium anatis]
MNELLPINTKKASITMGSREIAELVEARHDSVKRTVERLQDKGLIQLTPLVEVKNHLGQTVLEYQLIKRDTYVVVAQLCPEFTARLVDRWQELEAQQANNAFSIPQTLSQALRLAAEQAEKIEQQEQLIALQAPKAAFVDHYVDVGTSKSLRETAKILKMPEKAMIERLIEDRLLFRQSGKLLPFASEKVKPLFTVKTGTAECGHNYTQTRVTAEGMRFIAEQYATELMI